MGPFGPFLTLFGHLGGGQRLQVGPDPQSWDKMGRGVKIGGSRGPKCRLDPLLGQFLNGRGEKHTFPRKMGPKMAPKGGQDATWASAPTDFDSPPYFTPTLGVRTHLEPLPPTQMAKRGLKRPKRAQNGSRWTKKMVPKRGLNATWALETVQCRSGARFYP